MTIGTGNPPAPTDIRTGVVSLGVVGTLIVADASDVRAGKAMGPDNNGATSGTLTPAASVGPFPVSTSNIGPYPVSVSAIGPFTVG